MTIRSTLLRLKPKIILGTALLVGGTAGWWSNNAYHAIKDFPQVVIANHEKSVNSAMVDELKLMRVQQQVFQAKFAEADRYKDQYNKMMNEAKNANEQLQIQTRIGNDWRNRYVASVFEGLAQCYQFEMDHPLLLKLVPKNWMSLYYEQKKHYESEAEQFIRTGNVDETNGQVRNAYAQYVAACAKRKK